MTEFKTIRIEETDLEALKLTAIKAAKFLNLKKLSLPQLIHIMHEEYKTGLNG